MKKTKPGTRRRAAARARDAASFPIVGVGASAGGLEAFTQLLAALPANTGMAFVLIQHLDPSHTSLLSEALSKATAMPVAEIRDGMQVERNHVYVIPPNADVGILKGMLSILARGREPGRPYLPIDFFFRSLGDDRGTQAIGVVLSGTASDGTEGLKAIKSHGGVALAQDPQTAKFEGMPQSAIASGVVDFTGSPPEIASEIARLGRHPYVATRPAEPFASESDALELTKIFLLVRNAIGIDFSEYKSPTIRRRLARRMALRKTDDLKRYANLLRDDPSEAQTLLEDVLIHVTSFFRDPEIFDKLKAHVFPELVKHKAPGDPLRIWVTGCSTGQEAYSFAIALLEFLGEGAQKRPIQIFGSDISERAIGFVRSGVYPESAVNEIGPQRLKRFFSKVDGGYCVTKAVRDLCVFARHDLARDPPFSKIDLVSCRNVLIYFNQALQQRVLGTFHYCLNQPGYLVLGRSEGVAGQSHLFSPVDKAVKVFARTAGTSALRFTSVGRRSGNKPPGGPAPLEHVPTSVDVGRHVDNLLLAQYAPAGVIVNQRLEILQFRGRTGPYLEPSPGQPQLNLLKMAREGLLGEIRLALATASRQMTVVRKERVRVRDNGSTTLCNLVVVPVSGLPDSSERLFAVLFEEPGAERRRNGRGHEPARSKAGKRSAAKDERQTSVLARELAATKEYLRSLVEENQKANEALSTANDELVSGNEELQSMNEELETAKEELQSSNEELTTLNDELQNRNQELGQVNNDLVNLLNSVEIPIVILDAERRIRRFTPRARSMLNLLPSDVGRPLDDIKPAIDVSDLDAQIADVIESVTMKESEVCDRNGRWHRLQIRPYKTVENVIDGAVLSLVDVDALKRTAADAEWARDYALSIVHAVPAPLVVLDETHAVVSANEHFYDFFDVGPEAESRRLFEIGNEWNDPGLVGAIDEMLANDTQVEGFEFDREIPAQGIRTLSVSARRINLRTALRMVLLAFEDVTERKRSELERAERLSRAEVAQAGAEQATRAKDIFLATVTHELKTPLSALLMQAQMMKRGKFDQARVRRTADVIERATNMQVQLVEDLMDVSRIVAGKLKMNVLPVDLAAVVREALEVVSALAKRQDVLLESSLDKMVGRVSGDASRLRQVFWNLLANAIKFTPKRGRVTSTLDRFEGCARIRVADTGIGITQQLLPQIFDRFFQVDTASSKLQPGLGLGLALVRHIVEAHGGSVQAESAGPNRGATFTVLLPLLKTRRETSAIERRNTAAPPTAPIPDSGSSDLSGLRVLVVDDDPDSRAILDELLSGAAAEVRTAASAADAMEAIEQVEPEVLVADIAMPGEDGFSLIRRVRESARGREIPALALTALSSEADRQRILAAGFQAHLGKPVSFERLAAVLVELRGRARR